MNAGRPSPVLLLCVGLIVWFGSEAWQTRLPATRAWALLDEVMHASVALVCAVSLAPAWGYRPVLVAVAVASLLDVDHALAARSLDPLQMMMLPARPATHSLAGAALIGILAGAMLDARAGYAASLGVVSHVALDAYGPPGVPLLVPLNAYAHFMVPVWVPPVCVLVLAATGVLLTHMPWFGKRIQRLRFS